jgi:SNF2 family DNA or RNA helicase
MLIYPVSFTSFLSLSRAIFEHNHGFLMQSLKGSAMPKLMNIQMELRKCCNHPFLIAGVEQTEMDSLETRLLEDVKSGHVSVSSPSGGAASAESLSLSLMPGGGTKVRKSQLQQLYTQKRFNEIMVPSSGKMVLLDKLLPKLKNEGHKVIPPFFLEKCRCRQ